MLTVTVARLGAGCLRKRGSIAGRGHLRGVRTRCGTHPSLYSVKPGESFSAVNRPGRVADYSSQSPCLLVPSRHAGGQYYNLLSLCICDLFRP